MTSPTDETALLEREVRARPVPWVRRRRPIALPFIVALSLLVHATILGPLLFQMRKSAAEPAIETPVEIIQEPAPQAKKAETKPSQKDGAKEAEDKAAQRKAEQEKAKAEQAKQEQAKQEQAKQEQAKQEQAKQEQQAKAAQAKAEQQAKAQQQAEEEQAKEQQAKAEQQEQQRKAEQQAKASQSKPPEKEAPKPSSAAAAKQAEAQARVAERMRNLLGQTPPGVDAAALPGESASGTVSASYQQLVLSKLTKALSFDRHRGNPGFAVVTFVLGNQGEVASVKLDKPSGDPVLDQEALAVVRRGAPYPVPPPGGKREYTVTLESRPVL